MEQCSETDKREGIKRIGRYSLGKESKDEWRQKFGDCWYIVALFAW